MNNICNTIHLLFYSIMEEYYKIQINKSLEIYKHLQISIPKNISLEDHLGGLAFSIIFIGSNHRVKGISISTDCHGYCELALWDGNQITYEDDFGYMDVNTVDSFQELINEIQRVYNLCTTNTTDE